jgi:hypothetical protein
MKMYPVYKGIGNPHVVWGCPDFKTAEGKSVTYIHNHELDADEYCNMVINVPDNDLFWTYWTFIPYSATLEFYLGTVYSNGEPLLLYNKDFNKVTDTLGITAVCDAVITSQGALINSTKYGVQPDGPGPPVKGAISTTVGDPLGAGWFVLPKNSTLTLKVISHTNGNNVSTRFTFLEI